MTTVFALNIEMEFASHRDTYCLLFATKDLAERFAEVVKGSLTPKGKTKVSFSGQVQQVYTSSNEIVQEVLSIFDKVG